jgi:hypothetical protein
MTSLEWHFGQVGNEGKKTYVGFFIEIPNQKSRDFL